MIRSARDIERQLKKTGKVVRGCLGLYAQDVTPSSPTAEAGIQAGDLILSVGQSPNK